VSLVCGSRAEREKARPETAASAAARGSALAGFRPGTWVPSPARWRTGS